MKIRHLCSVILFTACTALTTQSFADDSGHHHGHDSEGHMSDSEHMHGGGEGHMREVVGQGRINKIMAQHHMVNIKHEPMPEMNWPQMSMNFKTNKQVNLDELKPGQEVQFKLEVDGENNYIIKEIIVK